MIKFGRTAKFELVIRSQAISTSKLTVRCVTREGLSQFSHTPTNDGIQKTQYFSLADIPIFLSVVDDSAAIVQGSAFVTISLCINGSIVYELCSGFVYGIKSLSWPISSGQDAMPGRGNMRTIVGSVYSAGEDIAEYVPEGRIWHLLSMSFLLTTSATVADRRVKFLLGNADNLEIEAFSGEVQAASLNHIYSLAHYGALPATNIGNLHLISIPQNIYMTYDDYFGTTVINLQANDQLAVVVYKIEEFFSPRTS